MSQANRFSPVKSKYEGTYGHIFFVFDRQTNSEVAIKKQNFDTKEGFSGIVLREMDVLMRINHPNIMRLNEVKCIDNIIWSVMDWYPRNLYEWTVATEWKYIKECFPGILHQILQAVYSLHLCGVVHYDLKPENIMIQDVPKSSTFPQGLRVVVTDFGLCNPHREVDITELCTVNYRPPELLSCNAEEMILKQLPLHQYGSWVDIWSVGCIAAEMITRGVRFFAGNSEKAVMHSIYSTLGAPDEKMKQEIGMTNIYLRPNWDYRVYPGIQRILSLASPDISGDVMDIIPKMLEIDYRKRATAKELLQHSLFSSMTTFANVKFEHKVKTHSYDTLYPTFSKPKVRKNLCKWMNNIRESFKMPWRTIFNAIQNMDRYFYRCHKLKINLSLTDEKIKILGLAALNLSFSYFRHVSSPLSIELVKKTALCDLNTLLQTERELLSTLNWKMGFLTIYDTALNNASHNLQYDPSFYFNILFNQVCEQEYFEKEHSIILKQVDDEICSQRAMDCCP